MTMKKKTKSSPVTVFAGNPWETGLLKSILENEGIKVFLKDEALGTLAPWYAGPGGTAAIKVVISDVDLERARPVVERFQRNREEEA